MPWPQEALLSVAQRFFGSMEVSITIDCYQLLSIDKF